MVVEGRPRRASQRVDRLAVGPAVAASGSPTLTRTRRPKRSQLVPLIATGTSGTADRSAK